MTQGLYERSWHDWGRERDEDWNSAVRYVTDHLALETDSLWCYAGLIEGYEIATPLSSREDAYLSFPLRGTYQVVIENSVVMPKGLVGDRSEWRKQISEAGEQSSRVGNNSTIDGQLPVRAGRGVWIVYRGTGERLQEDLKSAGLSDWNVLFPTQQFGSVSVVCMRSP